MSLPPRRQDGQKNLNTLCLDILDAPLQSCALIGTSIAQIKSQHCTKPCGPTCATSAVRKSTTHGACIMRFNKHMKNSYVYSRIQEFKNSRIQEFKPSRIQTFFVAEKGQPAPGNCYQPPPNVGQLKASLRESHLDVSRPHVPTVSYDLHFKVTTQHFGSLLSEMCSP
jgi:hypothetical protein